MILSRGKLGYGQSVQEFNYCISRFICIFILMSDKKIKYNTSNLKED